VYTYADLFYWYTTNQYAVSVSDKEYSTTYR